MDNQFGIIFSVFGKANPSNKCDEFNIGIIDENDVAYEISLEINQLGSPKNFITTPNGNIILFDKPYDTKSYLTCGQYQAFWLTIKNSFLQFGKGLIFFKNGYIKIPTSFTSNLKSIRFSNKNPTKPHKIKIHDTGKKIF